MDKILFEDYISKANFSEESTVTANSIEDYENAVALANDLGCEQLFNEIETIPGVQTYSLLDYELLLIFIGMMGFYRNNSLNTKSAMISDFRHFLMNFFIPYKKRLLALKRKYTLSFDRTASETYNRRKIMFVMYMANNIDTMQPVLDELNKDPINNIVIVALTNAVQEKLNRKGIKHYDFESYLSKDVNKIINDNISRFINSASSFDFSNLTINDMPLWDFTEHRFSNFMQKYLKFNAYPLLDGSVLNRYRLTSLVGTAIKYSKGMEYLISLEKPDIIIVFNEMFIPARAAIFMGKSKNIPTLVVQHNVYADHPMYSKIHADKMAVMGEITKKTFIKNGAAPDKIVVTGQPRYDLLCRGVEYFKDLELIKLLDIDLNKKIIVYTTANAENEELIDTIFEAMQKLPQHQLIIKLHPDDSYIKYDRVNKKFKLSNIRIVKEVDIYKILSLCDLLITTYSSTGLEAMILNKNIITINLSGKPDVMPYAEYGAAIGVYKKEEMKGTIENVLFNKEISKRLADNRNIFISQYAYKADGLASKRIANIIESMIHDSKLKGSNLEKLNT